MKCGTISIVYIYMYNNFYNEQPNQHVRVLENVTFCNDLTWHADDRRVISVLAMFSH